MGIGESYARLFREHLLGRVAQFLPRIRSLEILWSILPFLLLLPLRGLGGLIAFSRRSAPPSPVAGQEEKEGKE